MRNFWTSGSVIFSKQQYQDICLFIFLNSFIFLLIYLFSGVLVGGTYAAMFEPASKVNGITYALRHMGKAAVFGGIASYFTLAQQSKSNVILCIGIPIAFARVTSAK